MTTDHKSEVLTLIALSELGLSTLETRSSDRLDFSDQAVWQIKKALELAFEAGRSAALTKPRSRSGRKSRAMADVLSPILESE
jgi:hypothetical protein